MRSLNLIYWIAIFTIIFSSCQKPAEQRTVDVCIYGGSSAGVVAAVSAARLGHSVIIIEPRKHIGGLTTSGLGETDIGNKHAVTGISREFYRRLGLRYNKFEAWKFEPSVALDVFKQMLQAHKIEVLTYHQLTEATKVDARITQILVGGRDPKNKTQYAITAKVFIDASYEGDLMAKAGVSYTVGREPNSLYNEEFNGVIVHHGNQLPDSIDPYKIPNDPKSGLLWGINPEPIAALGSGDKKVQAYNYRLCLSSDPNNQLPFTRPANYDSTQFELLYRIIDKRHKMGWKQRIGDLYLRIKDMPNNKTDVNNKGGFSTDLIGGSWLYPEANWTTRDSLDQVHRDYTEGLLYFLAYDPRLPLDVREQMLKYGWAKDEFTDNGGFPFHIYVREARRMVSDFVMTEHHCTLRQIAPDAVAYGAYQMDSHNCDRHVIDGFAKNEGDVQVSLRTVYPISYRALVPKKSECQNLIVPVCLSASHIAYGSIRMEPVFMATGQAAGLAASMAINAKNIAVQDINMEEMLSTLNQNPLLNNTPPDIVLDFEEFPNALVGKCDTIDHKVNVGRNKTYAFAFDEADTSAKVTINFTTNHTAEYLVSWNIPKVWSYKKTEFKHNLNHQAQVKFTFKGEGLNTTITPNIDYEKDSWFPFAKITLAAGVPYTLTVSKQYPSDTHLFIADAVLLTPTANKVQ